jgi:hypothetical protein
VQVHCDEGAATHIGPEPCVDVCEGKAQPRCRQGSTQAAINPSVGGFGCSRSYPDSSSTTPCRRTAPAGASRYHIGGDRPQVLAEALCGPEGKTA